MEDGAVLFEAMLNNMVSFTSLCCLKLFYIQCTNNFRPKKPIEISSIL